MGVSTLKERIKEQILIYGLLQLCSLIYHAVPVHSSITPGRELTLSRSLPVEPATHPHVGVTSCVLFSGSLHPPSSLLYCHNPNTQTPRMSGIRHYQ